MKQLAKGAEAYIYTEKECVVKVRQEKKYRQPELDQKLRKGRTKRETTALKKCSQHGILCPAVLGLSDYEIRMSLVDGERLCDAFDRESIQHKKKQMKELGKILAKMHLIDICHGDFALTNIIETKKGLCVIDFGLCDFTTYHEKKAADLAVMYHSLKDENLFGIFVNSYREYYKDAEFVMERFEKNLKRGRYKTRD
jgi:Kae1-associated kinase Bud32